MADHSGISRDLERVADVPGSLSIWFLGQCTFVIRGGNQTLCFDPYLTDALASHAKARELGFFRRFPPPVRPDELFPIDVVLISHEHEDHFDPGTLRPMLVANPAMTAIAPAVLRSRLTELGFAPDQIRDVRSTEELRVGSATVRPVPAAHEDFDVTPEYGHRYLGYIVSLNGVNFYFSGDTVPYEGLPELLRDLQVQVLLLSINGRDWGRHRAGLRRGNMSYREAADLADAAGAQLVIPMHYDLFDWNGERPGHFADYVQQFHPSLPFLIMARNRMFRCFPGS